MKEPQAVHLRLLLFWNCNIRTKHSRLGQKQKPASVIKAAFLGNVGGRA